MIITTEIQKFILNNLFMLDTKCNIIMDGNFTKINYSNQWFTMNGLYILFPIEFTTIETNMNKVQMKYNPYLPTNIAIVQDFSKLEYRILEYYKQTRHCSRKISNLLSKQLYSGSIKIFRKMSSIVGDESHTDSPKKNIRGCNVAEKGRVPKEEVADPEKRMDGTSVKYSGASQYVGDGERSEHKYSNGLEGELAKYSNINTHYVIKISGIWESTEEIGLTYKLFETHRIDQ